MAGFPASGHDGAVGQVIYATSASLDGYVADRQGTLDWLDGLDHDPAGPGGFAEIDARAGAMVMGRATHDWVAGALERTGDPWPHRQPCWVRTRRPLDRPIPGADLRVADGSAAAAVTELRRIAGDADVWCVGGGRTASWLLDAGLLDEMWVTVAPVVLGGGVPLLAGPASLELREVARNGAFAVVRYRVLDATP